MVECSLCGEYIDTTFNLVDDLPYCVECFITDDISFGEFAIEGSPETDRVTVTWVYDGPFGTWERNWRFDSEREAESFVAARSQKIRGAMFVIVGDGDDKLGFFASSEEEATFALEQLKESSLAPWLHETEWQTLANLEEDLGWFTCLRHAIWKYGDQSASYGRRLSNRWFGDSLVRVDTTTLSEDCHDEIVSTLTERLIDQTDFSEIETIGEARTLGREEYQTEQKVFPQLGYALESYVREHDEVLSERSRMTKRNNRKGDEFEAFFRELVKKTSLEIVRGRRTGMWLSYLHRKEQGDEPPDWSDRYTRQVTEKAQMLSEELRLVLNGVQGGIGLPDYFVYGEPNDIGEFLSEFSDDPVEVSNPYAYVEVKYTESGRPHVPNNQREVIPQLTEEADTDVFFFIGNKKEHHIRRSWLSPRNS